MHELNLRKHVQEFGNSGTSNGFQSEIISHRLLFARIISQTSVSWQTLTGNDRKLDTQEGLPMTALSQNIFADIWPQSICGQYIQNKFWSCSRVQ